MVATATTDAVVTTPAPATGATASASTPVTQTPSPAAPTSAPANASTQTTPAATEQPKVETKTEPAKPTGTLMSQAAADAVKTEAKTETASEVKLSIPKDSKLTQADVDSYAAIVKAEGLNQKQADALLSRESQARTAQLAAVQKQFQESAAQFAADPEYGGAKLEQSKVEMRRVLNSPHMPADLKKVLSDPNLPYGDFAPLAKFITNIGRLLGEDGNIPTNHQTAKAEIPIHHVFYPPKKSG